MEGDLDARHENKHNAIDMIFNHNLFTLRQTPLSLKIK